MSDSQMDILRILYANEQRLQQTEVKEVPGAPGFSSFYATGTWTPAFSGTSTLGTYTYTKQLGFYTRIGDLVHVYGNIAISAVTVTPTGTGMVIFNLPIACASTTGKRGGVSFGYASNLDMSAGALYLTGLIQESETQIRLEENFDSAASAGFPPASFTRSCDISFFGFYPV